MVLLRRNPPEVTALVGDANQLPGWHPLNVRHLQCAVVEACRHSHNDSHRLHMQQNPDVLAAGHVRSHMERREEANQHSFLLTTQYRMHPDIARFSNNRMYGGQLVDHESVVNRPPFWYVTVPLVCYGSNVGLIVLWFAGGQVRAVSSLFSSSTPTEWHRSMTPKTALTCRLRE